MSKLQGCRDRQEFDKTLEKYMTHWHTFVLRRQSGIALPVALIMTLLIALLGMTMIRGGLVSELVTSNQQQKFISTEAAQSSIEAIWNYSYLKDQISSTGIAFDNPAPIPQPASETGIIDDYDFASSKGSVDIGGEVTVQFCGEGEGSNLDASLNALSLGTALIDISSRATIENSNAKSLIVQRAAITSVRSSRSGNCVVN